MQFDFDQWKKALLGSAERSMKPVDLLAASGLLGSDEFDEFSRQIQEDHIAIARSSRNQR